MRFACDAMLGGLSRWLRAAGYNTSWTYGIEDRALVEHAYEQGRTLLSSDAPLCRAILARGLPSLPSKPPPRPPIGPGPYPKALYIPRGLHKLDQLRYVLKELSLPVRGSLCMACGGELDRVRREEVAEKVPPRVLLEVARFFRCGDCGKIYWEGSHWRKISASLEGVVGGPK